MWSEKYVKKGDYLKEEKLCVRKKNRVNIYVNCNTKSMMNYTVYDISKLPRCHRGKMSTIKRNPSKIDITVLVMIQFIL